MKNKTLAILLGIVLLPLWASAKEKERDFFVFEPDIRLFASYAFANAAGYEHDYADMHPFRREVRAWLDSVLTPEYKEHIRNYYQEKGGGNFFAYGAYPLECGNPPEFTLLRDISGHEGLCDYAGYEHMLAEFYRTARIETLWKRYREPLREINLRYAPYAEGALRQITDYFRVDPDYYRKEVTGQFYYQQMPLMSHYTAFFHEAEGEYWVVTGPSQSDEVGPGPFYHESLHGVVNPVVWDHLQLNERLAPLLPLAQQKLQGSYDDLTSLICESFVRTIQCILGAEYSHRSPEELFDWVWDEYALGHILTMYLLESLPEYRQSGLTFREYYPRLIAGIDIERETRRWREFMALGLE